jgi:hypothetical protein
MDHYPICLRQWSSRGDLNTRPSASEADALVPLSYATFRLLFGISTRTQTSVLSVCKTDAFDRLANGAICVVREGRFERPLSGV